MSRAGGVEIDLVAARGGTTGIRRGEDPAFATTSARPEEAVDARKQARLVRGAAAWLHSRRARTYHVRFDVIVCELDASGGWQLRHLKNAFDASD